MMMSSTNRISQTLHEEHCATIVLMERLEQLIARHRRGRPDIGDRAVAQLLSELAIGVTAEVQRHFDFEEHKLFAYLDAIGDNAIGAHLTEEHSVMRPLGVRLAQMARSAAVQGFDEPTWNEFCRVGGELCERMLAHIQKEEMALLPLFDENMDSDTDARLYQDYVENV